HGFKTFANRTAFEYAETVTAIVGPNGSGKSNIADSLRWVLGEQSYSLLRAKKTEDMIFSGSESRPRAGMASATITFDNSSGWLPIDFTEVAITRRAYRDGGNDYLINAQKVRLKDVSELLAQSGLAERTYTIIGQGLVDAALSLKADERRRLFEEAAGIGLHRARREEALRRLETTQRNLERVEDILAELKPRLASLEKQARRAIEYEQVRSGLQLMLREWYGYHWHNAQQELAEARTTVQTQDARLERERAALGEIDARLNGLRARVAGLRGELNGWHKQLAELHSRRETFTRELAVTEERQRSIGAQQESGAGELERLKDELVFLQEGVTGAAAEVERLAAEQQDARRQVQAARDALSARQAERAEVEKLIGAARQELSGLNARQGQTQARLAESQAQAERAQKALESAAQAMAKAEAERKAADERAAAARKALQAAEAAQKEAEDAARRQKQKIEAAEGARRQFQEERSAASAELARLKAQLDVLDQAEAALTGYAGGAKRLLQAARQSKLHGARGAFSSFLEVPAELEKAVAAALGEFLDAVVLDGEPDAALDLLKDEAGRGVVLPLARISANPGEKLACPPAEGVLGVASEMIKAQEAVRPAVDLLLGQVLLVQDRPAARRALQGQPAGVRAVTLKGEIFYSGGPAMGGGGQAQTLLGRGRQRRELEAERQRLSARLAAADRRLADLDEELQALRDDGGLINAGLERARQETQKAARAADAARTALEAAERQARWTDEQRQRQQADLARSQNEAARLSKDLAELDAKLLTARQTLRQHNARLESLALDELQAQAGHWSTRAAVAERAVGDARTRLGERQAAVERSRRAQTSLETRLAGLQTTLEELRRQQAVLQEQGAETSRLIQLLNQQIEPAEAGLAALEGESGELQKTDSAARQSVSIAEHSNAQARITLARRQETLQSLRRRIEEDFGLVAFEYDEQTSGPTPLPLAGMVEQLPVVKKLTTEIEENIKRQRAQLRRMGAINPEAQAEYQEVKQRYEFLVSQVADLEKAQDDIRQVIAELDGIMQREFRHTFDQVAAEFRQIFTRLFGGGSARLVLTEPENLNASGIDIEARLPGRRMQGLSLLSGGERSLTAASLVFALLKVSPTPFCVLDEVDAMLDEANVGRFRDLLRELSQTTQFVIVTHNRNTVQAADVIYGVTMGKDSSSQVISLRLDEVDQVVRSD
ncbi:MAG: chromosome segregation protein SMC, partial [Chloroflexota bacterium]